MPAELSIKCNAKHGFAFEPKGRRPFGFLTALNLGGSTEIPADMIGADPLHSAALPRRPTTDSDENDHSQVFGKSIVGVLEEVKWNGEHSGELTLTFLVSIANWGRLDLLFRTTLDTNTKVTFSLVIYKWDYVDSCYFVRFCTDGGADAGSSAEPQPCIGYIYSPDTFEENEKNKSLDVAIADTPGTEHGGVLAYQVKLGLRPPAQEESQFFRLATSKDNKARFRWCEQ